MALWFPGTRSEAEAELQRSTRGWRIGCVLTVQNPRICSSWSEQREKVLQRLNPSCTLPVLAKHFGTAACGTGRFDMRQDQQRRDRDGKFVVLTREVVDFERRTLKETREGCGIVGTKLPIGPRRGQARSVNRPEVVWGWCWALELSRQRPKVPCSLVHASRLNPADARDLWSSVRADKYAHTEDWTLL
jgi:hypothetical protein